MPVRKSRGGCANCKHKKIKCDETKPACQRCTRLNQSCLGYNHNLKWSDKHEVFRKQSKRNEKRKINTELVIHNAPPAAPAKQHVDLLDQPEAHTNELRQGEYNFDEITIPTDDVFQLDYLDTYPDPIFSFLPFIDTEEITSKAETETYHGPRNKNLRTQYSGTSSNPVRQLQHDTTIVPQSVAHHDTLLVEYYFKAVATLYSCFDGNMNPFRVTIGKLWDSSLVTKLTMQSMAAACLCRDFPDLAREGQVLRSHALAQINEEFQGAAISDVTFLCLVMLGQSAGWHHAADLGLQQYSDARRILDSGHILVTSNHSSTFFPQALDYWNMILSFLAESSIEKASGSSREDEITFQAVPHPWALITPEMMETISDVGKLVLDHRRKFRNQGFWKQAQILEIQQMMDKCRLLELKLLNQTLPSEAEIIDPGDMHTPITHLIKITEAYRFVALIQLYRVFPDVLLDRVNLARYDDTFGSITALPIFEGSLVTEEDAQLWLRRLVLHTVQNLTSIPFESHTRSIQAFLYVALSSELRKSSNRLIDADTLQIIQARHFIQGRLEAYRFVFAPKPAQRKLDLVLKVWEQMDTFDKPAFWVDVMLDHNLEVVFC